MGKLLEILIGKAVCMSASLADGLEDDFFDTTGAETIEKMGKILTRYGFSSGGKEMFCDGITGEMIEAHVMSGVVHYVKLHHMVSKKIHARATGPRHLLTHQPNEGRSNNGGLRFGPMEVDCTLAHSASEILRERMLTVSDEFTVFVCSQCGFIADGNQAVGYFYCRYCKTGIHVRTVVMPYTSKLMLQELNASGIKASLKIE
jgi:DNA-directed RNA polymerase III subunit RPC2